MVTATLVLLTGLSYVVYKIRVSSPGAPTLHRILEMSETERDQRTLLDRPRYANAAAWHHVRQSLLKIDDPVERRRRFEGFVAVCGQGYRHGVRAELAAQGAREPYATLLAQLGGPPDVEPIEMHDLADQIDAMSLYPPTGPRLASLLTQLTDVTLNPYDPVDRLRAEASDYLAIACMKRLLESGDAYHEPIRSYVDKRIGTAEHHGGELRALRSQLPPPR